MSRVVVADLRAALARLLDAVEGEHGPEVDLDADFYWTVAQDNSAYRFDTANPALTVGSLSDDVDELAALPASTR
ncbi:hypothetical protein [Asanoa sp. NPDC050611]|uniref:hypothetical protein n=1 Tax=Asanoa sp. NPDC050611 TaxID=3157098 RepID=UPI0033F61E6B